MILTQKYIDQWNGLWHMEIKLPTYNHLIFNEVNKYKQWGKDFLFNKWYWDNWQAIYRRLKLNFFLILYTEIHPKWIKTYR